MGTSLSTGPGNPAEQFPTDRFMIPGASETAGTSTDIMHKMQQHRVPFLCNKRNKEAGSPPIKHPLDESCCDFLVQSICPTIRLFSWTVLVCIINIALFVVTVSLGLNKAGSLLEVQSTTLLKFRGTYAPYIFRGQVDRLLIAIFLHSSFMHLFGNLLTTLIIVSRVQHTYGTIYTVVIYIISGIAGNLLAVTTSVFPYMQVTIGASTALYGMLGLLIGYFVINWTALNYIPNPLKIRVILGILLMVVLAIIFTIGQANISHMGHLGGFLAGLWLSALPPAVQPVQPRQTTIRVIFIILIILQLLICFLVFYLGKPELKKLSEAIS